MRERVHIDAVPIELPREQLHEHCCRREQPSMITATIWISHQILVQKALPDTLA
jgi:hypothetical protein